MCREHASVQEEWIPPQQIDDPFASLLTNELLLADSRECITGLCAPWITLWGRYFNEDASQPESPPNIDDFNDSDNLPDGWDWRGNGEPGSRDGAYHNPSTGESLHDDRTHPPGKDPHTTYTDPNGTRWDDFGDGWVEQ